MQTCDNSSKSVRKETESDSMVVMGQGCFSSADWFSAGLITRSMVLNFLWNVNYDVECLKKIKKKLKAVLMNRF